MKIKGIEFSEETIVKALERAGISLEEPEKPYHFQAGDVVKANNGKGEIRIIVQDYDTKRLFSYNLDGICENCSGQHGFEVNHYVKIGVLSDYIK